MITNRHAKTSTVRQETQFYVREKPTLHHGDTYVRQRILTDFPPPLLPPPSPPPPSPPLDLSVRMRLHMSTHHHGPPADAGSAPLQPHRAVPREMALSTHPGDPRALFGLLLAAEPTRAPTRTRSDPRFDPPNLPSTALLPDVRLSGHDELDIQHDLPHARF